VSTYEIGGHHPHAPIPGKQGGTAGRSRRTRLPWAQIEASVAAKFERQERAGHVLEGHDMFGPTQVLVGSGISNAGRPKLPIRLMASP